MFAFPRVTECILRLYDSLSRQTPLSLVKTVLAWVVLVGVGLPLFLVYLGLRWWFPGVEDWVCGVVSEMSSSGGMPVGRVIHKREREI